MAAKAKEKDASDRAAEEAHKKKVALTAVQGADKAQAEKEAVAAIAQEQAELKAAAAAQVAMLAGGSADWAPSMTREEEMVSWDSQQLPSLSLAPTSVRSICFFLIYSAY